MNAAQPQTSDKPAVTFKERSFGMDLLRSAAIWTVMLAHISYWFNPAEDGLYSTFIMPLMLGVEPFFVLGGFLAAITFLKMRHQGQERFTFNDVKGYWYRRWARTLPNYFLFLIIYALAFSFAKPDFSFDTNYLVFTQNLFWLAPNFFSVSWSLATQEWFYLLFPLIFFFCFKLQLQRPIIVAAALVIGFALAVRCYFLFSLEFTDLEGFLRRVAALRIDSVVIGVVIGWLYFSRQPLMFKKMPFLLVCTIAIIALAYLRRQPDFNSLLSAQVLFYPTFSLLLACLMPRIYTINPSSNQHWNAIIENTSKWSYSIYLCHVFFKDGIYLISNKLGWTNDWPTMLFLAVLWLLAVYFAAAFIYARFEIPMMRLLLPVKASKVSHAKADVAI